MNGQLGILGRELQENVEEVRGWREVPGWCLDARSEEAGVLYEASPGVSVSAGTRGSPGRGSGCDGTSLQGEAEPGLQSVRSLYETTGL